VDHYPASGCAARAAAPEAGWRGSGPVMVPGILREHPARIHVGCPGL